MKESERKKRPYWHVDAKWISGIIFLVFFITGILFFNISQVISQKNVIDTASSKIEASIKEEISKYFDDKGKPLTQDKTMMLGGLTAAKDKVNDLEDESSHSASQAGSSLLDSNFKIFKDPLNYSKNIALFAAYKLEGAVFNRISGALDQTTTKISSWDLKEARVKDQIMAGIEIPKIYSEKQYFRYRNDAIIFLTIALLFLIAAIYFSSGFGRAFTPGFLMLMASMPGFFILISFANYLKTSPLNNLLNSDQKIIKILATAMLDAFKEQVDSLFVVYKYLFISALILLTIGIFGSILYKLFQPRPTTDISPQLK